MAGISELSARFRRVYANLPLNLRREIIAVIDGEPMTWNVVFIEVNAETPMAERILKYLNDLELI